MNWQEECNKEALALSKEKRQEFLNLMHKGKTIGEAREACGITFNAAIGIMDMNIKQHQYSTLRTESL